MEKVELTPLAKRFVARIGNDVFVEPDYLENVIADSCQEDIESFNKLAEVALEFAKEELVK